MLDKNNIWETVIFVLLAVTGGIARQLNSKELEKLSAGRIFVEMFISGFVGLMVVLAAQALGLGGTWLGVVSGMGGWVGPNALNLVIAAIHKTTGINLENKNEMGDGKRESK